MFSSWPSLSTYQEVNPWHPGVSQARQQSNRVVKKTTIIILININITENSYLQSASTICMVHVAQNKIQIIEILKHG